VLATRTHAMWVGQLGDVDEVVRHKGDLTVVNMDHRDPSSEPLSGASALRAVLAWDRKTLSSSPSSPVTVHPQRRIPRRVQRGAADTRPVGTGYRFKADEILNLDYSDVVIACGSPSGAHSDIFHPQLSSWVVAAAGGLNIA
jgi:hypothetical protein